MKHRRQRLGRLETERKEFEAGAISNAESVIHKRTVLPTASLTNLSNRIIRNCIAALGVPVRCLSNRDCGSNQQGSRHNHKQHQLRNQGQSSSPLQIEASRSEEHTS